MKTQPQNPPQVNPEPKSAAPNRGWFKVWRHDRARIIEQCEGATLAALAVWDALCDIANEKRASSFEASIGVIRTRAGTSRSTTFRAVELLEEMGMLLHRQNPIPGKKNALNISTYTLLTQSYGETSPQSDKETTPSPSKQGKRSDRGMKKSSKRRQEKKETPAAASALPLEAAAQTAGEDTNALPEFVTWNSKS